MRFKIFSNRLLGSVRTLVDEKNGEIRFLASDVVKILGYANGSKAIQDHTDSDDRSLLKYKESSEGTRSKFWAGNDRKDKVFVTEAGLYSLIFGSKLEIAKDFKNWVTREVLPSIRRNGGYIAGMETLKEDEREALIAQIQGLRNRRRVLITENKDMKSKLSKLRKELKAVNEYADLFEEMYDKLMTDYQRATVKGTVDPEREKKDRKEADKKQLVDCYGFVSWF